VHISETRSYRKLALVSVVIGVLAYAFCYAFASRAHLAFVLPAILSVAVWRLPQSMSLWKHIFAASLACVVSTAVFSAIILVVGLLSDMNVQFAFGMLPAPCWLPWLLMFTLSTLAIRYVFVRAAADWRWFLTACLIFGIYLASAGLSFDFSSHTTRADVEQPDAYGREPALGPEVRAIGRLVCAPEGPSFLLSRDYDGSEWLWKIYRPVILVWFALPGCRFYRP